MPVPVPRQRAIPALETDQAPASAMPGATSTGTPGPGTSSGETAQRKQPTTGTDAADATDAAAKTAASFTAPGTHLTLLVIEDDPGGSPSCPSCSTPSGKPIRVRTARNLTEAERLLTDDVHCILLDLALPAPPARPTDGNDDELAVLKHVLRLAPRHAVLALTASGDAERGAEAVRVGAQDYLFRDELDGRLLSRAIRYAVERKRADSAQRQLTESRLRAQENARLERGLLPTPLLDGSDLRFAARYRPGRSRALLGGDFYDTVRTPDGTVHAMIGDVCGHGPDEAALGVELRIAWRALTLAGLCGDALLGTLQQVLEHERAERRDLRDALHGRHLPGRPQRGPVPGRPPGAAAGRPAPDPGPGAAELLPVREQRPGAGLLPRARWPRRQVRAGRPSGALMLYTDGLIEGRVGAGREAARPGRHGGDDPPPAGPGAARRGPAGAAVSEVRELNGGELTDDVAVLLLDRQA